MTTQPRQGRLDCKIDLFQIKTASYTAAALIFTCLLSFKAHAAGPAPTSGSKAMRQLPGAFDIAAEPRKADWQFFLKAPEASRSELWNYQVSKGQTLKDWSWGWRLGWVRACGTNQASYCQSILQQALQDKALVVRAEAVTRLGRLYEDSGDQKMTGLLTQAYQDPRNLRQGSPLFIQSRILFALNRIGGDAAKQAAAKLAKSHPTTQKYWTTLSRTSADKTF